MRYPLPINAASVRVLEKAGYVREGHLRRSAIKDGKIRDQLLYAAYRTSMKNTCSWLCARRI